MQGLFSDNGEDGSAQEYLELIQAMNNQLVDTQRELARALNMAESANHAKSDFLARMSHDMRTPINAVMGFNELIRQQVRDGDPDCGEILRYLDYSDQSARFLLSLISDILDLSRIEKGTMVLKEEPVSLASCIEGIGTMIRSQMEAKSIAFTVINDVPRDGCYRGDRMRIEQILMNLLSNAVKFTPSGGAILLKAQVEEQTPDSTDFCFMVQDSGIGMSEEFQRRMFKPFEQEAGGSGRAGEGVGLGLAISKQLVEKMGGTIDVDSSQGQGTTFLIRFMLRNTSGDEMTSLSHDADEFDFSGRTALVCDDNEMNRIILRKLLEARNFEVLEAEDGKQASELFEGGLSGAVDIIFMDVMMPVMDGLEAARTIRSSGHPDARRVPIVAITANAYSEDVQRSVDAGMDCHLTKPIDKDDLYRTARRLLAGDDKRTA